MQAGRSTPSPASEAPEPLLHTGGHNSGTFAGKQSITLNVFVLSSCRRAKSLKVATIIHSSCSAAEDQVCRSTRGAFASFNSLLLAALLKTLIFIAQAVPLSLILEKLCYSNVLNLPHCLSISRFNNGPPFVQRELSPLT